MSLAPILVLPPIKWEFSQERKIQTQTTKLGDGYGLMSIVPNSMRTTAEIVIPNLSTEDKDEIISLFIDYGGITKFRWRPLETLTYKEYICDKWSVIQQGTYLWQISATFAEQKTGGTVYISVIETTARDRLSLKYFPLTPIADFIAVRQFNYGTINNTLDSQGIYPGNGAFAGGVLLTDGRVFCVPHNALSSRIYNPITNIITTPNGAYPGSSAFFGGVLLPDGKVFCVPYNSLTARIYNPFTNTLSTPNGAYPGSRAFAGGVLLPDGRVFCIPHNSTTARIYDPIANTLTTPNGTYPGNAAFTCGVLLTDGRVFCVPFNSTTARIYDPIANTLTTPNGTYPGNVAFAGGVLLPDGRVFCVPYNSTTARIYDPVTNTLTIPNGTYAAYGFFSGVLLPNGNVFCAPMQANYARIYNPNTNTLTTATTNIVYGILNRFGVNYSLGAILLPDGRVFSVPHNATTARVFGSRLSTNLPMGRTHSAFDNKL